MQNSLIRAPFVGLGLLLILGLWSSPSAGSSLSDRITTQLKNAGMGPGTTGVHVFSPDLGPVYSQNERGTFITASVMKIFTAVAALEEWGPAFQFPTQLLTDAKIDGGILKGNLYLRGHGDPSFVSEKMWYLANEFLRWGVTEIQGDLVVDDSRFDQIRFDPGRLPHNDDRAFDAPIGALSFNWNAVNIFSRPGSRTGAPLQVYLDLPNSYVRLENKAVTGGNDPKPDANVILKTKENIEIVSVHGRMGLGSKESVIYRAINQPEYWAGANMVEFLKQRGINVRGQVRKATTPSGATLLAESMGSPMRRMTDDMLKFSNNFVAEMLTKALAAERGQRPATMNRGLEILREFAERWRLDKGEYSFTNPAGLSRKTVGSANSLVQVLEYARNHMSVAPEFISGLPVSGVDGTLKNRMKTPPALGRVRAKTGMLDGVISLAGYIERLDGKVLSFAMIYNGPKDPWSVHAVFDKICTELVSAQLKEP